MSDRKSLDDQNDTPEDVATLYSWANLHGAKYRDFSASRALTRENVRQRMQEAIGKESQQSNETSEAVMSIEAQHTADAERAAAAAREAELAQQSAQRAAQLAAQEAEQRAALEAAQQRNWQQPMQHWSQAVSAESQTSNPASSPASNPGAAPGPVPSSGEPCDPTLPQSPMQQSNLPDHPEQPPVHAQQPQAFRPGPGLSSGQIPVHAHESLREEGAASPRNPWAPLYPRQAAGRPAWLSPERADVPKQTPPQASTPSQTSVPPAQQPQSAEDTLQGSRDRLASRWFALRGVFAGPSAPVEAAPAPVAAQAPVMAVFSLAGGVGKTTLVATLGRALAARGERVLLVDTAAYGLLPFFFGARDQRPGLLRTFSPPGVGSDAPIQMVATDPESLGPEGASADASNQNTLSGEIGRYARGGVSRVIVDLATASGATTRRIMRMAPMILVPVAPDMNSVVSVSSIDDFFEHNTVAGNTTPLYYVMNQFDPSLPLHLDVREVLREQLGDRLLPFALRRATAVSEALAEGMTVMDYAPNSTVAEDFGTLAGWVKSLSAPASTTYRGVRWSER